jgi:hypothetical protein
MSREKSSRQKPTTPRAKPVSLHGLSFEEALSGLLAVKPPKKKAPKKKRAGKKS